VVSLSSRQPDRLENLGCDRFSRNPFDTGISERAEKALSVRPAPDGFVDFSGDAVGIDGPHDGREGICKRPLISHPGSIRNFSSIRERRIAA